MIRLWAEAPDWATHIVAPVGSPDSEMWAELIDGSHYSKAHRIERAKTMEESFSLGIVVVSARETEPAQAARIAPPAKIDLSEASRNGRPPKAKTTIPIAPPPPPPPPPKPVDGKDIAVSTMGGALLTWAVALATGLKPERTKADTLVCEYPWRGEKAKRPIPDFLADFGRGWLFLNEHSINLNAPHHATDVWAAWIGSGKHIVQGGNTPQEAICRCVVVLLIGQRVFVPTSILELTV